LARSGPCLAARFPAPRGAPISCGRPTASTRALRGLQFARIRSRATERVPREAPDGAPKGADAGEASRREPPRPAASVSGEDGGPSASRMPTDHGNRKSKWDRHLAIWAGCRHGIRWAYRSGPQYPERGQVGVGATESVQNVYGVGGGGGGKSVKNVYTSPREEEEPGATRRGETRVCTCKPHANTPNRPKTCNRTQAGARGGRACVGRACNNHARARNLLRARNSRACAGAEVHGSQAPEKASRGSPCCTPAPLVQSLTSLPTYTYLSTTTTTIKKKRESIELL
jgi:hypothetical protein